MTEVTRVEVSSYFIPIIKEKQVILQNRDKTGEDINLSIKNLIKEIEKLEGIEIPICAIQGDYDLTNLLFAKENISILDFEHFMLKGNSLFDLANLTFNPLIMSIEKAKIFNEVWLEHQCRRDV